MESLVVGVASFFTPSSLVVGLTSFFAFVAMGMTGFGPAIVFHVGWDFLIHFIGIPEGSNNPVRDAVLLLTVNAPFSLGPLALTCWSGVRWDVFWFMFIPNCLLFCAGTELLTRAAPTALRSFLAILMVAVSVWRIETLTRSARRGRETVTTQQWSQRNQRIAAGIAGGLAGFLNGAFNIPGPPLMIFFAMGGFNKDEIRSTTTALLAATLPLRYYYFFVVKGQFNSGLLHLMIVVIIVGQLGLQMGMRMFAQSSDDTVQWFMLWLILSAATAMLNLPLVWNAIGFFGSAVLTVWLFRWTKGVERTLKLYESDPDEESI